MKERIPEFGEKGFGMVDAEGAETTPFAFCWAAVSDPPKSPKGDTASRMRRYLLFLIYEHRLKCSRSSSPASMP